MDTRLIFVRTEKGEAELKSRAHGLVHGLRFVLILVDGKSPVETIMDKGVGLPDIHAALEELARGGFIRTAEEAQRGSTHVGDPRQEMILLAQALLGKHSTKVVKKIQETSNNPQDLARTAEQCKKLIKLLIDDEKSDEFVRRSNEILFIATTTMAR
ncbi:MAG: hypothetical protein ACYCZQ_06720 [Burkholderiales bacterium]